MIHRFFFYILILFLPTQLGFHVWPEWSMVLGRRIDFLSPTLYLTDILILFLLVSWRKISVPWRYIVPIALFAAFNIFYSLRWQVALYAWVKIAEYACLGLYIVKTKPSVVRITFFLSLAVLYSSTIAIAQFFLQHSLGGPLWFLGERTFSAATPGIAQLSLGQLGLRLRAYGTFSHPNVLGGFLAIVLPFMLSNTIVISIGILALFLTFSRSAWIVFLLGILLLKKRSKFIYITVFLCILYVVGTFHSFDESVVVRQQLMDSSIEVWKTSPWFGVGLGNFIVALPTHLPSAFIYFLQPVHNIYLLLVSEIGIIGLIGLIGLIWKSKIYLNMNSPLFTLLLLGFVDHYPLTLQQGQLMLTLLIGLLFL